MTADVRRRAAAHVLVDDVTHPTLDERDAHHVFRVLRVRDGDTVTVTDGAGNWRVCTARSGNVASAGDVEHVERRAIPLTVACAVPKQDRPEWIVQKLTEIGIDRIILLQADRSVVRWSEDRAAKHLVKLRRVAREALQQSRGVWLPTIDGPVVAEQVLGTMAIAEPGGRPLSATDHAIAIGPEGGWSDHEKSVSEVSISLGSTVLRVETAAIVAASRLIGDGE